ncbi:MAG: serine hydrolase, partial [Parvularculaceae bacterium]|nr:serine hydrolase [Parvularculaceae bacterium]
MVLSSTASLGLKTDLCQQFVRSGEKGGVVKLWVGAVIGAVSSWLLPMAAAAQGVVYAEREANGVLRSSAEGRGRIGAPYQSGSIAKYACTLAAIRLQSAGRLSLDAPVRTLLPGFDNPLADDITLRLLLQNRTGIADGVVAALRSDPTLPSQSIPALEAANRFSAGVDGDAPGTAFSYVNSNWIVVQAIL